MEAVMIFLAACFLAYSNGANDNFKGVATLFGSGTTNYKKALRWATGATIAGSICSIFFAQSLVKNFSGKGIVPDEVAGSSLFLLAVALSAGLTVIIATFSGFPISTTHGLTGAIVGAGFVAVGAGMNFATLGQSFFLPLLASPLIATTMGSICYVLLGKAKSRLAITEESCLCIGKTEVVLSAATEGTALNTITALDAVIGAREDCARKEGGVVFGVNYRTALDSAHYLSAGLVSFARGLNDTPKIVALLIAIKALGMEVDMLAVAIAMALGGLLGARKVAETMSLKITSLSPEQGFSANLVTAILVVFASRLGLPVSTTHVSVGSLFGIGLITKKANFRVLSEILLSWILTLPVAAVLSASIYWLLQTM